jgi:hypothetical protein
MACAMSHHRIYHITHVGNLPAILAADGLLSDRSIHELPVERQPKSIAMSHIKQRRLHELQVPVHPGSYVGDDVPFYFCPRSVMLYILAQGRHPDLAYGEGQEPIVHLEAYVEEAAAWAESQALGWAFTLSNAGARTAEFRSRLEELGDLDWEAIRSRYWQDCRDAKQAEFLVRQRFPWHLVRQIGVRSQATQRLVTTTLEAAKHRPPVEVRSGWYY